MISIALPTGTLLPDCLALLRRAGVLDLAAEDLGRRLLVEQGEMRAVLVRPTDVPAYVDHGAVDLGIAGKDSIWETDDVPYELTDLGFGPCRFVLAVPDRSPLGGRDTWPPSLRVASKYPRATMRALRRLGQSAQVVHLHGSVELAPLVGLADAIADLTASGRTLRENELRVIAELGHSTARLIANQASLKTRWASVGEVVARIRSATR
ncbi:MAG: ATP phosphoribosyltransferase [Candidatus Dormibacteraceae bacterium]